MTQKETEKLNRPLSSQAREFVNWNLTTKSRHDGISGEFYQTFM